jgi:hypothetical protein
MQNLDIMNTFWRIPLVFTIERNNITAKTIKNDTISRCKKREKKNVRVMPITLR